LNYTFSREFCVPFSLFGFDGVSWIPAIDNYWQFFVRISDYDLCSNSFNFYHKLCKLSPHVYPPKGNNVQYSGNLFCPQLNFLKVFVTEQRALEFEVLAYTNCSSCICNAGNAGCSYTTQYEGNIQWTLRTNKIFDADAVNYLVSSGVQSFEIGVLKPGFIQFNCNTNYSCP